jgi:hypothetical protein
MPLGASRFGLLGGVADLGKLELIHTENASSVSSVDFQESAGTFDTSYNVHFLTYNDITTSVDNISLDLQFYESGILETASVYQVAHQFGSPESFGENKTTTDSKIRLTWGLGTVARETGSGYKYLYNLSDSSKYSFTTGHWTQLEQGTSSYYFGFGSGVLPQASTVNGFRLKVSSGNFSGTVSLYGIAES